MKTRCRNHNCESYVSYGVKGIRVEDSFNTYHKFYTWAIENGYKINQGLEIDREDSKKGYSSKNCRFVSKKENLLNKVGLTIEDLEWIKKSPLEDIINKLDISELIINNIKSGKTYQ